MTTKPTTKRRPERLIFLPVLAALIGGWVMLVTFTLAERGHALERAQTQLGATVVTLADFHELANAHDESGLTSNDARTAAIWRALLQYPTANIWVETEDGVAGVEPLAPTDELAIVVEERRESFAVHAVLPQAEALVDWRRTTKLRFGILALLTIAFLVVTTLLSRAMQQRGAAELHAAAAEERSAQLAIYRTQLQETVRLRTSELEDSNTHLDQELKDRIAAEAQLQQHDALLHSVAKGAADLLGTHSLTEAATAVLELFGKTVGVSRAHINQIDTDQDGHLKSSIRYEWCAPGMKPMVDDRDFHGLDLTTHFPRAIAPLLNHSLASFYIDELSGDFRRVYDQAAGRSFLQIPILVEEQLWGSLNFIDSSADQRQWTWAETDTLQTLAGLIGIAIARARFVRELADANMIVQNSPTVLYRLRAAPSFPLTYISHNITKFGHNPKDLIESASWTDRLMGPQDRDRVWDAMARLIDSDAQGAAIEFRMRTAEGEYRWVDNRYTPVRDKNGGLVEIEGMITDITERKAADEKIAQMARTDGLTGLANRATFIERMRNAFAGSRRGASPFAVLYLDLDHFKGINDTLGHATGDQLLREVAERLRGCTREMDTVARLGGDEFAILQMNVSEPEHAGALAAMLQKVIRRPFVIGGNHLQVTMSTGICTYDAASTGPDAILAQADLALYRSKEEGRNRYRFHSDDLDEQVRDRVTLTEELRNAIEADELVLYYQPQVALDSGNIVGMEALVRWQHPTRGLLPAAAFIPVAETTGAIIALGKWVLEQACRQMREWRDAGLVLPTITLNVSLAQLKHRRDLIDDVLTNLARFRLEASDLSFDVTEATLAQVTMMQNDVLSELRQLGVRLAIDDFGSAYSSFAYLRTYRIHQLKLAQSYIQAADNDPERSATVRAIINLARELGIDVITNGVETAEQRDRSSETATIAQGFFFSDALATGEASELLRRGRIESVTEDAHARETA